MDGCSYAPVPVHRRELMNERQLDGLRVTESWHRASSVIVPHAHEHATITLLVDGSFEESYRYARDVACVAPAVHLRPAGELHWDRLGRAGAHNIVLELDERLEERVRGHCSILDGIHWLADPRSLALIRGVQRELVIDDDASGLALEGLALDLLATASRQVGGPGSRGRAEPPAWLLRARDLLHDRFREQGLRIAELAAEAEVHPVHLARVFRGHFGVSPGAYLRRLRVDWAQGAMRSPERRLADIASAAGFADQSHLSRVFKLETGSTPAAWRRAARSL